MNLLPTQQYQPEPITTQPVPDPTMNLNPYSKPRKYKDHRFPTRDKWLEVEKGGINTLQPN